VDVKAALDTILKRGIRGIIGGDMKKQAVLPAIEPKTMRLPGMTSAVSDTGPLISAFQSDSLALLTQILAEIHVPTGCVVELTHHGWEEEVRGASPRLVVVELTPAEENRAESLPGRLRGTRKRTTGFRAPSRGSTSNRLGSPTGASE